MESSKPILTRMRDANRKNGKGRKQVKTAIGAVEINPPVTGTALLSPSWYPSGIRHLV